MEFAILQSLNFLTKLKFWCLISLIKNQFFMVSMENTSKKELNLILLDEFSHIFTGHYH